MDENWKLITEFTEKYKNTLVLDYTTVKVLRGCTSDEHDHYWLLQDLQGRFVESSCVGEIIPLKNFIPDGSYERLRSMFQLNLEKLNEKIY